MFYWKQKELFLITSLSFHRNKKKKKPSSNVLNWTKVNLANYRISKGTRIKCINPSDKKQPLNFPFFSINLRIFSSFLWLNFRFLIDFDYFDLSCVDISSISSGLEIAMNLFQWYLVFIIKWDPNFRLVILVAEWSLHQRIIGATHSSFELEAYQVMMSSSPS